MIIDRNYDYEERLYSTGYDELDELIERAFCDGYEYAQREFNSKAQKAMRKAYDMKRLGISKYTSKDGKTVLNEIPREKLRDLRKRNNTPYLPCTYNGILAFTPSSKKSIDAKITSRGGAYDKILKSPLFENNKDGVLHALNNNKGPANWYKYSKKSDSVSID